MQEKVFGNFPHADGEFLYIIFHFRLGDRTAFIDPSYPTSHISR